MSPHALGELTREGLPARVLYTIKRGSWLRPDVLVVDGGPGPVVVKDWAPRSRPLRALLVRSALRREARAHRRLEGIATVPRLLGRLDSRALVLEYRAGTRISGARPWLFDACFAQALAGGIASLHARGVVHLDLAHRGNVGADPNGSPVIFDLGAAFCLRTSNALGRALLRALSLPDRRALRKWRRRVAVRIS